MFFELVATFAIGLAAGGIAYLTVRLTRGRLPRWLVPVAAGLAMIGFSIWSEYNWYWRTAASLPERVVVTAVNEDSAPWRPWTYVFPLVNRFVAMDTGSMRMNTSYPDQVMVDLLLMARWTPGIAVPVVFDCAAGRRADLLEGATIGPDGAVQGAAWTALAPNDPSLAAACKRRG